MKVIVSDFRQQMLQATEILAFDWQRGNLSVKVTTICFMKCSPHSTFLVWCMLMNACRKLPFCPENI